MQKVLAPSSDVPYALMRVVAGALFACHGAQKVLGLLGGLHGQSGATAHIGSLIWVAGLIELGAGLMVAFGLRAGLAAFLASGEMAVAYFMAHAPKGFWPILNGGELAVLYCFVFLYIATRGSGRWSVDSRGKHAR